MKIKATPETIWKRPAYLPHVHPALTDEVIREAERKLGCTLPTDFLDVLRVQNGGPIRFRIPDSIGDMIAGIGPSFPSITDFDLLGAQDCVDFRLEGLVPFDGDGHWFYCLDFRENAATPCVSYIDVECNSQHLIAGTFSGFMDQLELEIEDEVVLKNVENIDDAIARLEALFESRFEANISNAGFRYLKIRTGKKWDASFSITSNRVAHGYSGSDQDGDEFHFEGETLLFPELHPDAVIFDAGDEYIESYRAKLLGAGLELIEIEAARVME